MNQKYDFELRITRQEYSALIRIRGLASDAHAMVMCAPQENDHWILRGSHEAFDALIRDLDDEIECGLSPKKYMPALQRVREYITPESDDAEPYSI